MKNLTISTFVLVIFIGCVPEPIPQNELIDRGREIFFNETFAGNGRTCGSCHPSENNFTLDAAFIAKLPDDDPLFVAEFNPDLKTNFENPKLMRLFGLILENQDGFDDLGSNFNMRGVPHTLGLSNSVASRSGPQTGWSGDGAPGDGSVRSFATGAVIQHFTKTLNRIDGIDFRLPTDEELDALDAFQLSLGNQEELKLPLPLKGIVALRGQSIFNDGNTGKCSICHSNAGANGDPNIFGPNAGNLNFNTGVEALPDQPADLVGELNPPDDGLGAPGDSTFNTPSLVEAADTGPFFHNNSVETIEGAVAFYNGNSFRNSPSGQLLAGATGSSINLDATQVVAVAAFLRAINALENIRQSTELLDSFVAREFLGNEMFDNLLERAGNETNDALQVLVGAGLHPEACAFLNEALDNITSANKHKSGKSKKAKMAISALNLAKEDIVDTTEL